MLREMLEQVFEGVIGQAFLIRPGRITEYAIQPVGVGGFDGPKGFLIV